MTREEVIAALVTERFGAPPPRRLPTVHHGTSVNTDVLVDRRSEESAHCRTVALPCDGGPMASTSASTAVRGGES